VDAMPACHRRIAGSNPSTAILLLPSARRFKSDNLRNFRFYSCRTFFCERFQVTLLHLSKRPRNVLVKWHDIALYKSADTLPLPAPTEIVELDATILVYKSLDISEEVRE